MPDLHRDARLAADRDRLVERVEQVVGLAADVRSVDAPVPRGDLRKCNQLLDTRIRARRVDQRARDAQCPLLHRHRSHSLHLVELLLSRLDVAEPKHQAAYGGNSEEGAEVDRAAGLAEPAEVASQVRPVHLQLEAIQKGLQLGQEHVIERCHGAALSSDLGGDALTDLRLDAVVDQDVQLGLAEQVNKTRRHHPLAKVNPAARRCAREISHGGDLVAADADVRAKPWGTGAIDHATPGEHQIVVRSGARGHYRRGGTANEQNTDEQRQPLEHGPFYTTAKVSDTRQRGEEVGAPGAAW